MVIAKPLVTMCLKLAAFFLNGAAPTLLFGNPAMACPYIRYGEAVSGVAYRKLKLESGVPLSERRG